MTAIGTTQPVDEQPPQSPPPPVPAALPYGPRMTRALPALRRGFLLANRYLAVPMLRAGLGPLVSTPLTGSLMVLRTRGRRSGAWRDAPLGYVIRDGSIYCCAGFGRTTSWLRNLEADPVVEVVLPARALSGIASIVVDPSEQVAALRDLLASMSAISRPMLGDVRHASDRELQAMAAALPVVRIRPTGLAAGPWDPGGRGWAVVSGISLVLLGRWGWRLLSRRARRGTAR